MAFGANLTIHTNWLRRNYWLADCGGVSGRVVKAFKWTGMARYSRDYGPSWSLRRCESGEAAMVSIGGLTGSAPV